MRRYSAIFAFLYFVCCSPIWCRGAAANAVEIVDGRHGNAVRQTGDAFVNRFAVPTREQALAKLAKLRETREPVTVGSFLGGKIRFVRVTFFDDSIRDFETSRHFLQDLLGAVVIPNNGASYVEPPRLAIDWAEASENTIQALIFFENGSVGRIESDGWHLFLEDSDGTYWWDRLPARIMPGKHST
jgi:hypothetical protein